MMVPVNVRFDSEGGCVLEYQELPADYRVNGMALTRMIMVPPDVPAIADALAELRDAAQRALKAAVSEFEISPPVDADEFGPLPFSDDEPLGYDNPDEREHVR